MSLSKFEIKLHKSPPIYSAGESITGDVIVKVEGKKPNRGIKLIFKGEITVDDKETVLRGIPKRKLRSTKRRYFYEELYVLGCSDGEEGALTDSIDSFPFTHLLPANSPSSFEYGQCTNKYTIEAIMERSDHVDHKEVKPFTVENVLPIKQPDNIDETITSNFYCCLLPWIRQGSMNSRIHVSRDTYAPGDTIEISMDINNNSNSIVVTKIETLLTQIVRIRKGLCLCSTLVCYDLRPLSLDEDKLTGPFLPNASVECNLRVPLNTPPTILNGDIVSVRYFLLVKLYTSGCHLNPGHVHEIIIVPKPRMIAALIMDKALKPATESEFPDID